MFGPKFYKWIRFTAAFGECERMFDDFSKSSKNISNKYNTDDFKYGRLCKFYLKLFRNLPQSHYTQ